jgi:hypothetical protein
MTHQGALVNKDFPQASHLPKNQRN